MAYSIQFGQPCWEKDQSDKCINIVAQVAREQTPLFLATHSPIKNIKDAKADSLVTEEKAYKSLFSRKGEIRAVVRGGSGTGKSHLIRWINLRAEYGAQHKELDLNQFKIVMVQRETGSLRAALKQIVDQLGDEFANYIEDIKRSVDKFSANTARQELIQELALEVKHKWEERGHEPLPRDLKDLGDVLLSPGYRKWLGREGGIVAQIIARWTESSTQEDREKSIVFTNAELNPPPGFLNNMADAPKVHDFIQDLEYDEDTVEATVKILNRALIDAQRELTGIKGAKLNEIFTSIRRKLHTQGKQLAVFIEDVTAASGGLDYDLFQAFEPKAGKDLCRMVALLGMTNEGWFKLPENEQDRVDFEYDVGENAIQWATDYNEVAKFAARYLNALRCDDQEINDLAQNRFASDVPISKCDKCPHLNTCHDTFGYAQLEGKVKIGLFPFSQIAPHKLLKALNQDRHRSSPRGLLDLILNVALTQSYNKFEQNDFPDAKNFGVHRQALTYWAEFENKYLGGTAWSTGTNRDRARFLAEFWIDVDSADETASALEPYRTPLSLPAFSQKTGKFKKRDNEKPKPDSTPRSTTPIEDSELKDLLTKLEEWNRGKKLTSDSKFRDLLSNFVSKAMRWQDHRRVPIKFASQITKGTKPIRIEGQIANVVGQLYFLDFPRDEKTRNLLEALVRYEREGKKSWDFDNGELHKRQVYRWLRKNQQRVLTSLEPTPPTLAEDAIKVACQLLALTAILRIRSSLPKKEPQKRIEEIFTSIWESENRPKALTELLRGLIVDIEAKWNIAKELIISELGVGQGTAVPKDFIDTLPILDALHKFEDNLVVEIPPQEISENFWKVRFGAVSKLGAYARLSNALIEERKQIKDYLEEIRAFLSDSGFNYKDIKKQLGECVKNIIEVVEIQKKNLTYPNMDFDNLWDSRRLQNNRDNWSVSVNRATKLMINSSDIETLCYDPTYLEEVRDDLCIVTKTHLERVEEELCGQEKPGGSEQGGTKEEFLNELKHITTMLDKE